VSARNPYSPPTAVVADQQTPAGEDAMIPNGRNRPLHHGWKWIADGWSLFKRQPGMWILSVILFYVTVILVSLIPFVNLFTSLLWPIFTAGFFVMSNMAYHGERFNVSHLFSGFKKSPGTLALIGGTYLIALFAIIAVFVVFDGPKWFNMAVGNADPTLFVGVGIAVYMLVTLALGTAIAFAPALVQLNDVSALQAMRMSFIGCAKNVLPGTLFAVLFFLLMVVSMIPLGLGLLITIPMITTTFYSAYRDIFLESKPA
jgi:uncharacterized membrane protein